jgi:hypothetical protein
MSRWSPCKRRLFIKKLKKLGDNDPETGGRHEFMLYSSHKQTIPNNEEFSVPQLKKLIRQVEQKIGREIAIEEWHNL